MPTQPTEMNDDDMNDLRLETYKLKMNDSSYHAYH